MATDIDPLREYAHFWLERTAIRLGHPNWLRLAAHWIADVEAGRPGFAARLREVARDVIAGDDVGLVHKGVAALAVVGTAEDLPALARAGEAHGGLVATHARTAAYEIEHRAPAI